VAVGVLLVGSSYVGRFREATGKASDLVTAGLWLGGLLATVPLVIAVVYHRFIGPADLRFSAVDELALFGNAVRHFFLGKLRLPRLHRCEKKKPESSCPPTETFSQKGIWLCLAGSNRTAATSGGNVQFSIARTRRCSRH
jgi:hypothetical protein